MTAVLMPHFLYSQLPPVRLSRRRFGYAEMARRTIVFVQHLSPQHESSLSNILARETELPVQEARSDLPLRANHVYVIPPDRDLDPA